MSSDSVPAVRISGQPIHDGRINPMLFGNFIELLDDLVPGMWAEMLNDRSFEGVLPRADWCYYQGEPNFCDRAWEAGSGWTLDSEDPFNGAHCARLTSAPESPAVLRQAGMSVKNGMRYSFSGYFRSDSPGLGVRAALKAPLPDGTWMELASAALPEISSGWTKHSVELVSSGTADDAVFDVEVNGAAHFWADKLSLMPADNLDGWRADVVQAIREMKPSVIRWGGCVCDPGGYKWKEGIGDRDLRMPFPNVVWGRIDSNDVGMDEFCRFCELVDAEPLICISFADGPASAADLVRYCNGSVETPLGALRAANGHPEPYGIRYWQMGNELGDKDYIGGCAGFCREMKEADPSIVLLSSYPSQEMLDLVGQDICCVAPHHYTPDLDACDEDIEKLTAMIRNTPGCGHVKLAVTEWNISSGSWGQDRGKMATLDCAIRNARYLNLLMRHSNTVEIACRSNMANSLCCGVIETRPGGLLKRPSYYTMKLYAGHAKPVPHAVDGLPEGLDVAACSSEDGRELCIFAINTTDKPIELALDVSGFGPGMRAVSGEVVCDTQDRRQKDAMNHWSAPDRVKTVPLVLSGDTVSIPAFSVAAVELRP